MAEAERQLAEASESAATSPPPVPSRAHSSPSTLCSSKRPSLSGLLTPRSRRFSHDPRSSSADSQTEFGGLSDRDSRRQRRRSHGGGSDQQVLLSVPTNINGRLGRLTATKLTITPTTLLYGRYEIELDNIREAVRQRCRMDTCGMPANRPARAAPYYVEC
jgi:hypothetical protein